MDDSRTTDAPGGARGPAPKSDAAGFRPATFQQAGDGPSLKGTEAHPSLEVILDVPVTLSLEVGRTQMSVGHLLRLSQGSVVELDRNAGEPLDVLVNGALVAHGEIVVVNDKFGIRLTDVVAPADRKAG